MRRARNNDNADEIQLFIAAIASIAGVLCRKCDNYLLAILVFFT